MKILNKEPLSLIEVKELIEKLERKEEKKNEEMKAYLKKFTKLKISEVEKLKHELQNLDLIKVKSENIIKIIDLLPEDASDLNKLFTDTSLDENEINKILEVVKKYK